METKELDIAFALVRGALEGRPAQVEGLMPDAGGWWRIFRLMQQNHVAALTADTMAALAVPREVKIPWLAECDKAVRRYRYQLAVQQEIVDILQAHGVETMVLKGTHTAQYYPVPERREFGDLDLYFYKQHREADAVAREVLKVELSNESHHHSKYDYRGVTVESHYDYLNRHYPPSNRGYDMLLKAYIPCPILEVLFLVRHMAGHFAASRITLRDLVDWALLCRAQRDEVDWPFVETVVEKYGMMDFVLAVSAVAERRLGIEPPPPFFDDGTVDDGTVERIARDIVYGTVEDHAGDGIGRLGWKLRRWNALRWKRRMVYKEPEFVLCLASIASHIEKPRSIVKKV